MASALKLSNWRGAFAIGALVSGMAAGGTPVRAAESALAAFPGAEGYGRGSQGGRGGAIIYVTSLDDAGPGTLRACIEASGPRVCIFRIGGIVRYVSERPIIRNPYLTIAGQSAPGGGVVITHSGGAQGRSPLVVKNTHDVVVRHIRVRMDVRGDMRAVNSGYIYENSHHVIFDHVSGSWALDENIGGQGDNDHITISSSIFAEGVPRHDKCALLASDPPGAQHLSFVRNICAHNGDRNPDINVPPGSCVDIVNNVFYDAQSEFTEVWESAGGTPVNIIGNVYKAGPSTARDAPAIVRQRVESTGRAQIHMQDNRFEGRITPLSADGAEVLVDEPVCPPSVDVASASEAYEQALTGAGAFPRDAVDTRIVSDVRERTGRIVSEPGALPAMARGEPYVDADRDGMSDEWERANGVDPGSADPWADADGDGWLNLDEFLDYAHEEVLTGRPVR